MQRIMKDSGVAILREVYAMRAARRSYSLRAFARDLGLSHSYLSLILNDKKRLPPSTLVAVSAKLGMDREGLSQLEELEKNTSSGKPAKVFSRLEIDKFRLMSQWYYIAILELAEVEGFVFSPATVAEYFGLGGEEVREALAVLKRLGLLKVHKGRLIKVDKRLSIVAPTSLEAIRSYHRQMILKAVDELSKANEPDFKLRDITGMTMPINPKRLAGAKRRITRFRRSLEAYLTQGKCTEVYQFNIQLFPLRNAGKSQKNEWEKSC